MDGSISALIADDRRTAHRRIADRMLIDMTFDLRAAAHRAGHAGPYKNASVSATQLSSKNRSPSVRVARDRLALKVFPGSVALPLSPVG